MSYIKISASGASGGTTATEYADFASFPAASGSGNFGWAEDTNQLYYDEPTSSSWIIVGSGGTPSLTSTQVAYGSGTNTLTSEASFNYNATTNTLNIDNILVDVDATVTSTLQTQTLDINDNFLTLNSGGNDASSEDAGLVIERTGTNGSLLYEDALASKFKAGALGSEIELANISSTQIFTNKTIDADNNTLSNIEVDNLKAGVLDIDLSSVSASDDTLASAKAIKSYVDSAILTRYVDTFDATTDWGVASGGYYTITVLAATHGRGVNPIAQLFELNGADYDLVAVDRVQINASGDISYRVPETPDLRFEGKIIIL